MLHFQLDVMDHVKREYGTEGSGWLGSRIYFKAIRYVCILLIISIMHSKRPILSKFHVNNSDIMRARRMLGVCKKNC